MSGTISLREPFSYADKQVLNDARQVLWESYDPLRNWGNGHSLQDRKNIIKIWRDESTVNSALKVLNRSFEKEAETVQKIFKNFRDLLELERYKYRKNIKENVAFSILISGGFFLGGVTCSSYNENNYHFIASLAMSFLFYYIAVTFTRWSVNSDFDKCGDGAKTLIVGSLSRDMHDRLTPAEEAWRRLSADLILYLRDNS